jgi:hypothetical protein
MSEYFMSKEKKVEEAKVAPMEEKAVDNAVSMPILDVYVSFDDTQLAVIHAAGLESAQVRNELGLALVGKEKPLTLEEAILRAIPKYKVSE